MPDHALPITLPAALPGLLALTRREILRFFRQPARVIAAIATPLLIWIFLASGFAQSFSANGATYAQHLLPGMVGLSVVFSSIFAAISLIDDRNEGFLQGVLVSPLPRWALVLSKVLGGTLLASIPALILLPGAYLLGQRPGPQGLALAIAAVLTIALTINALSLALAWRINSVPGFHGIMNTLLMPMWMLSGAFFPVEGAAPWLRAIMLINPLTWGTEALRHSLSAAHQTTPYAAFAPVPLIWLVAIGFAFAALLLAWWSMGRVRPA